MEHFSFTNEKHWILLFSEKFETHLMVKLGNLIHGHLKPVVRLCLNAEDVSEPCSIGVHETQPSEEGFLDFMPNREALIYVGVSK